MHPCDHKTSIIVAAQGKPLTGYDMISPETQQELYPV